MKVQPCLSSALSLNNILLAPILCSTFPLIKPYIFHHYSHPPPPASLQYRPPLWLPLSLLGRQPENPEENKENPTSLCPNTPQ